MWKLYGAIVWSHCYTPYRSCFRQYNKKLNLLWDYSAYSQKSLRSIFTHCLPRLQKQEDVYRLINDYVREKDTLQGTWVMNNPNSTTIVAVKFYGCLVSFRSLRIWTDCWTCSEFHPETVFDRSGIWEWNSLSWWKLLGMYYWTRK